MPTYDYFCDKNGRKVEVFHKLDETLATWGALCDKVGIEPGDTPRESPVRKLIGSAAVVSHSALSNPEPACASGGCCAGGSCAFNRG